ncbi:hypothetical protein WJX73_008720 [Symbiochloris irregularis]|uniref:F-box domain-containing protein n=1 Tax=Symbiochloris irregularis TaxID=706552 RepID=A0AAW1PW66_9CHLO
MEDRGLEIVVHPLFLHTLPKRTPVKALQQPRKVTQLPKDMLQCIAQHIGSARDLCTYARLCTTTWCLAQNEALWQKLCCTKFNTPQSLPEAATFTWKEIYRLHHKVLHDVLMQRRPDKLLDIGRGAVLHISVPVMA